jgi:hypothetical protein
MICRRVSSKQLEVRPHVSEFVREWFPLEKSQMFSRILGPRGSRSRAELLHVVIHRELVRVRSQAQGIVFFLFHVDPVGDEVFVEDVAT